MPNSPRPVPTVPRLPTPLSPRPAVPISPIRTSNGISADIIRQIKLNSNPK